MGLLFDAVFLIFLIGVVFFRLFYFFGLHNSMHYGPRNSTRSQDTDYPRATRYPDLDLLVAGVMYGTPAVIFFLLAVLTTCMSTLMLRPMVHQLLIGVMFIGPIVVFGWIKYMIFHREPIVIEPPAKSKAKTKRKPKRDYDNLPY